MQLLATIGKQSKAAFIYCFTIHIYCII